MHTLRQIEAEIQRQFTEHKLNVDKTINEASRRSQEAAFRMAEELFAPQLADLRARFEDEVSPLCQKLELVSAHCKAEDLAIRKRFERDIEGMSAEVASLTAGMAAIRNYTSEQADLLKRLQRISPASIEELTDLRNDSCKKVDTIRSEIKNETSRDEAQETKNLQMLQARVDAGAALMKSVDERAREHASTAIESMGVVERRLLLCADDTRTFATNEAVKHAETALTRIRPEILEAKDFMQERLDECLNQMNVRYGAVESQLRCELETSLGDVLEKSNRMADLKATEVAMSLSEGLEITRRDLRSQAEQSHTTSQSWKAEFQEAMTRLDSVAAVAKMSSEQIRNHAAQQLSVASSQLREEIAQARQSTTQSLNDFRKDIEDKLSQGALPEQSDAMQARAECAIKRVDELESNYDRLKAWLEDEARDLSHRCHKAQSEASDLKQRLQRDNGALGKEISRVRMAATSLTHGLLKTLQVIGLLSENPRDANSQPIPTSQRWGADVQDLLEWEKLGRSLADRVSDNWNAFAPVGVSTVLALLNQKAGANEVRMVRQLLNSPRATQKSVYTPSTSPGLTDASPMYSPQPGDYQSFSEGTGSPLPFIGCSSLPPSTRSAHVRPVTNFYRTV